MEDIGSTGYLCNDTGLQVKKVVMYARCIMICNMISIYKYVCMYLCSNERTR